MGRRADEEGAPAGLLAVLHGAAVPGCLLCVATTELIVEFEIVGKHDRLAAVLGPEQCRAHGGGEAAVKRRMRCLQRPWRNADLPDLHPPPHARAILHLDRMLLRIAHPRQAEIPALPL